MTFHLCCTQPQRTFGFRISDGMGHPSASLQQFTRLWSESRRRTPFKRPKLYFIKAHKVTFSRAFSHTHTHTERVSAQDALPFACKVCATHTHTQVHRQAHAYIHTMGIILLWLAQLPCAAAIILVSLPFASESPIPAPRRSFLHAGGLCLCDNRIYCFIKFVFKLPFPLSLLAFAHCLGFVLRNVRELLCGVNEWQKVWGFRLFGFWLLPLGQRLQLLV